MIYFSCLYKMYTYIYIYILHFYPLGLKPPAQCSCDARPQRLFPGDRRWFGASQATP